jgi:hypothetical protein
VFDRLLERERGDGYFGSEVEIECEDEGNSEVGERKKNGK